jgi:hypothetical protein
VAGEVVIRDVVIGEVVTGAVVTAIVVPIVVNGAVVATPVVATPVVATPVVPAKHEQSPPQIVLICRESNCNNRLPVVRRDVVGNIVVIAADV